MIVYVNGDSHSAGAEAINGSCFAEDDKLYWALGRQPHPENLKVSYGCNIANMMYAVLHCDAESASSNQRILRTTQAYLETETPDLVIIGWSTWEREEWLYNNTYYQVTAGGTDTVPAEAAERYRNWVIEQSNHNNINSKVANTHTQIWNLHKQLDDKQIPHLFFNTYSDFGNIKNLKHLGVEAQDWSGTYVDPYSRNGTYYEWCLANGFKTVRVESYHFAANAHRAWAEHLYQNYIEKLLTK